MLQHRLTDAKTLDRAVEALSNSDERPTSVEILKDGARIWYDLGELHGVSLGEFCLHVPANWFWGKKKREKWIKADRVARAARIVAAKHETRSYLKIYDYNVTYTPMVYFASVPIKGGKYALVERNSDDKFELTKMAREWLIDNIADSVYCEYWQYGDTAQLAFKFDADRLNFVKWVQYLREKEQEEKKKGKKKG